MTALIFSDSEIKIDVVSGDEVYLETTPRTPYVMCLALAELNYCGQMVSGSLVTRFL